MPQLWMPGFDGGNEEQGRRLAMRGEGLDFVVSHDAELLTRLEDA
ncbi:UNVERIFIED_ORG: hypothetical protein ABIB52_004189 [Arthrobacter sp. UYCu721]